MQLTKFFAQFNPFAVRVAPRGDTLVAYRRAMGFDFIVHGRAEKEALTVYVSRETLQKRNVVKSMIGAPAGFVNKRQGAVLHMLLGPAKPKVKKQVRFAELPEMTGEQKAWIAWNKPELEIAVNADYAYLAGKVWPATK